LQVFQVIDHRDGRYFLIHIFDPRIIEPKHTYNQQQGQQQDKDDKEISDHDFAGCFSLKLNVGQSVSGYQVLGWTNRRQAGDKKRTMKWAIERQGVKNAGSYNYCLPVLLHGTLWMHVCRTTLTV
jgi:hypothetical protein